MPTRTTTLLALLLLTTAHAQTTAVPDPAARLQSALTRAAAAESALRSSLPSFACKENVLSDEIQSGRKPRTLRHVAFTADVRVERRADNDFHETFEPASWADILAQSRGIGIPFYVSGGFQHALDYFAAETTACYRFDLNPSDPNRIDFALSPGAERQPGCKDEPGLNGFALLDNNLDIIHLERRVPEQLSRRSNITPFAAIDLAPTLLNGKVYRLSSRVISDGAPGPIRGHFEATYTACHLFHTTVTIEPTIHPVPDGPPPPVP